MRSLPEDAGGGKQLSLVESAIREGDGEIAEDKGEPKAKGVDHGKG